MASINLREYVIRHEDSDLIVHQEVEGDLPKGAVVVCYSDDLVVYYEPSRYYKMSIVDRAYHACLIAQNLGLKARDLRYPDKPQKSRKKAHNPDKEGRIQKSIIDPDTGFPLWISDIPF